MLEDELHVIHDTAVVRDLIDRHPWAMIVSGAPGAPPRVSHLPLLLDPAGAGEVAVLGHLARSDADAHGIGNGPVTVVVQGPHGYVSPTLYQPYGPYVGTWNFVVLHLEGTPEVLDEAATWDVLQRTQERAERDYDRPWQLDSVRDYAHALVPYVIGFRLRADRVISKAKLSQDKPAEVVAQLVAGFESDGEYANAPLAAAMRELGGA